jgi:hypothetical protein
MTWLETFREGMGGSSTGRRGCVAWRTGRRASAPAARLGRDALERVREASVKLARMIQGLAGGPAGREESQL